MDRREEMRSLLVRREREGLTFRELSAQSGVPFGTLASWAWKLRQEFFAAIPVKRRRSHRAPGFVELVAAPEDEAVRAEPIGEVEVVLASGRHLVVREGFDEECLLRLVRALERC